MKIEKCPFCGKQIAEITNCNDLEECRHFEKCPATEPYVCVVCNMHEGGCGASSGYYDSEAKAIAAWNRRADDERLKNALKEIIKLACESVKRDVELARLEAEVMQLWEAQRWTDAEYDTPDIGQAVLLYMPDNETDNIRVGEYIGEGDYRIGNKLYRGMEIDAWRPLPAAPEEGERRMWGGMK